MRILVCDITTENGDVVTALSRSYGTYKEDRKNQYMYLLGKYTLENTSNIVVINAPEVKKTWLHRLWSGYIGVKKYLCDYETEQILSLQNTDIPFCKLPQTVYVHNALPFSEHRFSIDEDKKLWTYQNLIGSMTRQSIKKANAAVVQTNWMKNEVVRQTGIPETKVQVVLPEINPLKDVIWLSADKCTFFYPASDTRFRNHDVILEVLKLPYRKGIIQFRCVFTLKGDESSGTGRAQEEAVDCGVDFLRVGRQNQEQMSDWFAQSILLFLSYSETVGLPICEAMSVGAPVLLPDCSYVGDVAKGHINARCFVRDSTTVLAQLMEVCIVKRQGSGRAR